MSVMPVPELPGALCRQHPDPDLWTSDMRSEQEEARRVCRICPELAGCRAWTLAQPAYHMDAGLVAAMTRPSVSQSAASAARSPGWPSSNRSGPARSRGTIA